MPTIADFIESCALRFQSSVRTIRPCSNCQHLKGDRCTFLDKAITSPGDSTCPGYETSGESKSLDLFDCLLAIAPSDDRVVLEQLLKQIRDEYPNGSKILGQAIALMVAREVK